MNIKKYIIGAGLVATILGGASLVLAQTAATDHPKPMIIQVGPSGKVLLRGTIKTVSTSSLMVTSWGGDWTVNVSSDTNVMPENDLSKFQVGDFVGVQGSMNQSAAFTIDARLVRDWTIRKEAQANRQEIKDIKKEAPRNWGGIASSVNADAKTMTLTIGSTAYTVNVTASAKIVNQKFLTINFSDIKNGDRVDVFGSVSDTTITAGAVRDISIK